MVIPYSGAAETIAGLDLIRRDAGARNVRVVVIDLAGAIIDESFGALELERVLETIEQLGAEPILTGISPLSERTVAGLEVSHLVVRKDLPAAIADRADHARTAPDAFGQLVGRGPIRKVRGPRVGVRKT